MNTHKSTLTRKWGIFVKQESGATSVEYAIMLGLIIGAAFAAIEIAGGATVETMTTNSDQIGSAMGQP